MFPRFDFDRHMERQQTNSSFINLDRPNAMVIHKKIEEKSDEHFELRKGALVVDVAVVTAAN